MFTPVSTIKCTDNKKITINVWTQKLKEWNSWRNEKSVLIKKTTLTFLKMCVMNGKGSFETEQVQHFVKIYNFNNIGTTLQVWTLRYRINKTTQFTNYVFIIIS